MVTFTLLAVLLLAFPMALSQVNLSQSYWTFAYILSISLILFAHVTTAFAAAKRLHDMDESGQLAFFIFAPAVGTLFLLWIAIQPYSDLGGENKYGPNPRKKHQRLATLEQQSS